MTIKLVSKRLACRHSKKLLMTLLVCVLTWSQPEFALTLTAPTPTLFPVCRNGRCGYIDRRGRLTIGLRFEEEGKFAEELAPVRIGMKWGYVDQTGQIAISPEFTNAGEFMEGLAPVQKGSKWGYINKAGSIVIEPRFDDAKAFSFGFACVSVGVNSFYVDSSGHRCAMSFWGAPDFTDGLTPAADEDKVGYVDSQLNWSIRPQFTDAGRFSEGLAPVEVGEKWGYIDRSGKVVISPRFVSAESFSEGLAAVAVDLNRKGYIDKSGRFVITPSLRDASSFSEGLAQVVYRGHFIRNAKEHTGLEFVGSRLGYINKSGKLVIKLVQRADYAGPFVQGLAYVRLKGGGSYGYINRQGRYIWRPSR